MRLKIIVVLFCLFYVVSSFAQTDSSNTEEETISWIKPSPDEKSRFGVIMGVQLATLNGTAIPDNRPMMGVLGGGYGRYNFNSGWSLQQAVLVSFKGSNFVADPGEIWSLRLMYLDMPFLILKKLNKKSKHRVGAGVQYSNLLNATMYIDTKSYPSGQEPKLDKNDWSALVAYQYQFDYFAIQSMVKYGTRNLNLGYAWPDGAKPLNNNGTLQNLSLEINFIF